VVAHHELAVDLFHGLEGDAGQDPVRCGEADGCRHKGDLDRKESGVPGLTETAECHPLLLDLYGREARDYISSEREKNLRIGGASGTCAQVPSLVSRVSLDRPAVPAPKGTGT